MKKYSFKNIFFNSVGQFFLIGLLSLTVSCKDEPARITGDVLPDGEKIQGLNYDAYTLDTRNTARESVRTSDATYGIIGAFNDPEFGQTKADFLTDFSIGKQVLFSVEHLIIEPDTVIVNDTVLYKFNNTDIELNDVWKVDSLVLNLQYQFNNWYGDMLSEQNVKIYELITPLGSTSKEYFNDHDVNGMYNPMALAEKLVHPNYEVPDTLRNQNNWADLWQHPDSLLNAPQYLWDNDKVEADIDSSLLDSDFNGHKTQIKTWDFNLGQELAERFFNFDEGTLRSTSALKSAFNGLYITADLGTGTEGSLTKINLLSSSGSISTNLTIHLSRDHKYENSADEIRDTTSLYNYTFPINVENVRFNRYAHSLSTNIKIENPEDVEKPTADLLYIQGMAGSYTRMQLPDEILNWVDSIGDPGVIEPLSSEEFHMVSNIEFFMEVDTVSTDIVRYPIPNQLTVKWLNDKGELDDPIYTTVVNGNKISSPIFGSDANSSGQRSGVGERVIRYSDEGRPEYLYRFIMRADYFNYVMRNEDGGDLNEKEFYIGPTTPTSNFQRVILFSGVNEERPMKMNIKYFKYRAR